MIFGNISRKNVFNIIQFKRRNTLMRKLFAFTFLLTLALICNAQAETKLDPAEQARQDSIIDKYLKHGAWQYNYFSRQWQENIDEGLKQDSTVAYLWQQKAMPLFKQRKYELAMTYLDRAVRYDTSDWIGYRAFIKCIFAKTYRSALSDLALCKQREPDAGVMDHSYDFYMALCYLQLNQFDTALTVLKHDIAKADKGGLPNGAHYLDLFYLGIAYYELEDYNNAIAAFDRSLQQYPNFSDAEYYKGQCVGLLGDRDKCDLLISQAKADAQKGFSINEDNAVYEMYPYQVNWK